MADDETLVGLEAMSTGPRAAGDLARAYLVLALAMLPSTAYAYVDPGTGMLFIQGLVAAIGAVIVFIRNPVLTIRSWIEKLRNRDKQCEILTAFWNGRVRSWCEGCCSLLIRILFSPHLLPDIWSMQVAW